MQKTCSKNKKYFFKKSIDKSCKVVYNKKVLKRIVMTMASDYGKYHSVLCSFLRLFCILLLIGFGAHFK